VTKSPLEEFLEAALAGEGVQLLMVPIDDDTLNDRVALVKALWVYAMTAAPAGAWDHDGPVLTLDDPTSDGTIMYERITYGDKPVIEAEGIVVWHINT
jgi:hypothetical protein